MNSRAIQQVSNDRIYSRNIPSVTIANPISFRPVITKYTHQVKPLPMIPEDNTNTFSVDTTFTPGDRKSPWAGYKNSIDVESILRDQITPLGESKKYVPNIFGDMYNDPIQATSNNDIMVYPYLFKEPEVASSNPPQNTQTNFSFYNSSRLR
jgi:hypothetical protein